jgi:hypothetical protein
LEARLNDPGFVEQFAGVCEKISRNKFLRGEQQPWTGRDERPWICDFDWITRNPTNWRKVAEDYYERWDDGGRQRVAYRPTGANRELDPDEWRILAEGGG